MSTTPNGRAHRGHERAERSSRTVSNVDSLVGRRHAGDCRSLATPHSRRNGRSHERLVAGACSLLLFALAACGGGGGGGTGDSTPPEVIAAAFLGTSPTPTSGDSLVLAFDEDVQATAGAAVTDDTFALSAGATFGTSTTVDSQPTARSVRLSLGSGVTFSPSTTTIAFAATNAIVRDLAGNLGIAGAPVVIDDSDGAAPTVTSVTLASIDAALNGEGPAGGRLQVPQTGFPIDIAFTDAAISGAPLGVDAARTRITANVAVTAAGSTRTAGTDLAPFLTLASSTSSGARFLVPSTVVLPQSPVTFSIVALDQGGLASTPRTFSCTARIATDALRPFETTANAQQVWFLDTSRDVESFTTTTIAGGARINIVAGANGRFDWLDVLQVMGLQTTTPQTNGTTDSNTLALSQLQDAILAELETFCSDCNIAFRYTQPSGTFGATTSFAYASFGYSQICLGGSAGGATGVLGVAQFDPNNARQNNDCLLESGISPRLGVFLHTIADDGFRSGPTTTFRVLFNQFAPALGGNAVGTVANDLLRLQGTVNDVRATLLRAAIAGIARYVAVVTAHECGHSMGLVQNGAMPTGLYGNDPVNFPGSTDSHIRNEALFSGGGINIMAPTLSYALATDPATRFNSLNLAYLREQVLYGN